MTTCIYGLLDHVGNVRYIGKTTTPRKRLLQHLRYALTGKDRTYKGKWIRLEYKKGRKVTLKELLWVSTDGSIEERRIIANYRKRGHRLTNLSEGGDGIQSGYRHTDDAKRNIVSALLVTVKNRGVTWKNNIATSLRGRKRSAETLAKIRANWHMSAKGREAIRQCRINTPVTQETRKKISKARQGHSVSTSTREKIRSALKGRKLGPLSKETRLKISKALRGRKKKARSP